jgi:TonB family protein
MRVLLIVVLSLLAVAARAAGNEPIQKNIEWTLSLAADGKIESMKPIDRENLPEVRKQIEPIVRSWHFTPGKINGQPAPTETTLNVAVRFDTDAANPLSYRVHIASAATGPMYRHLVAPHYPTAAQRSHDEGEVMLLVTFDADGRIVSAKNVPEMSADHISPLLVETAIDAVKKWTFRTETVGGRGVASEALVPICFMMSPTAECHWRPRPDKKPVRSGEAIALSSVVGLDTGDEARQLP